MEKDFDVEKFLQKKEDINVHLDNEKNSFDYLQNLLSRESRIYGEVARNIKGIQANSFFIKNLRRGILL